MPAVRSIKKLNKRKGKEVKNNATTCGICQTDYAKSEQKGGFAFHTICICAECSPSTYKDIKKLKATDLIRAICPDDMEFRNFCRRIAFYDMTRKV